MSNFKEVFVVKQHTPMVHFQSDQYGATLRATELKPKFDKFLIKYAFGDNFEEYKTFLIGYDAKKKESDFKGKKAFDYKIKIQQDTSLEDREEKMILYFGNMGDNKYKYAKFGKEPFIVEVFTLHADLKRIIDKSFEAFLANTNFGTRQSKGYGSFYIDDIEFNTDLIPYTVYSFRYGFDWEEDIKLLYQFLRQGINLPTNQSNSNKTVECRNETKYTKFYCKPAIFAYAKSQDWTWDKKAIKSRLYPDDLEESSRCRPNSDILSYNGDDEYLLRDLFGLSTEQQWDDEPIKKVHQPQQGTKKIERFKSPITFKKHENKIYFWANDTLSSDTLLGKTFRINNIFNIPTPDIFLFDTFFHFAFQIDLNRHLDNEFINDRIDEYKRLKRILGELKTQVEGVQV